MTADVLVPYLVCGVIVLFGVAMALGGAARVRELEQKPKLSCGAARAQKGPARIAARVESPAPLRAPLTEKPCVYYCLEITRPPTLGEDGDSMVRVYDEAEWADGVRLVDGTGELGLLVEGAELELGASNVIEPSLIGLGRDDLQRKYGLPEGRYSWSETLILQSASIEAAGEVVSDGESFWLDCARGTIYGKGDGALGRERRAAWLGWLIAGGAASVAALIYSGLFS